MTSNWARMEESLDRTIEPMNHRHVGELARAGRAGPQLRVGAGVASWHARGRGEVNRMQPLQDGQPGPDETWEELAEHSIMHDDLPPKGSIK